MFYLFVKYSMLQTRHFYFLTEILCFLTRQEKYVVSSHQKHLTNIVGTHQKHLSKVLLMSTQNICFRGEISKISILFSRKR